MESPPGKFLRPSLTGFGITVEFSVQPNSKSILPRGLRDDEHPWQGRWQRRSAVIANLATFSAVLLFAFAIVLFSRHALQRFQQKSSRPALWLVKPFDPGDFTFHSPLRHRPTSANLPSPPMWRNGRRIGLKIQGAVKSPCRFESDHRHQLNNLQ